jgi:hypothetical protein
MGSPLCTSVYTEGPLRVIAILAEELTRHCPKGCTGTAEQGVNNHARIQPLLPLPVMNSRALFSILLLGTRVGNRPSQAAFSMPAARLPAKFSGVLQPKSGALSKMNKVI